MNLNATLGAVSANSLITVARADAYHEARGNAAWANAEIEAKQTALVRACDYLAQYYGLAWQGTLATPEQALDWPRTGVVAYGVAVSPDVLPPQVGDAQAVLALKALAGDLAPDLTRGVKQQTVGPITTIYDDYSPQSKRYTSVDRMLAPYLASRNPYSAALERS